MRERTGYEQRISRAHALIRRLQRRGIDVLDEPDDEDGLVPLSDGSFICSCGAHVVPAHLALRDPESMALRKRCLPPGTVIGDLFTRHFGPHGQSCK